MSQLATVLLGFLILSSPVAAQTFETTRPPRHCSVEDGGNPQYPELLKGSGIEGTVLIQAVVGEDGCTKDVTVVKKVHPKLDQLAKQAVASWKFKPAKKDGKAVTVLIRIPVQFKDPGK